MHLGNMRKSCNIVAGKAERKRSLWRSRRRQKYNIKMDLQRSRQDLFGLG
jgi:hypothetical protein